MFQEIHTILKSTLKILIIRHTFCNFSTDSFRYNYKDRCNRKRLTGVNDFALGLNTNSLAFGFSVDLDISVFADSVSFSIFTCSANLLASVVESDLFSAFENSSLASQLSLLSSVNWNKEQRIIIKRRIVSCSPYKNVHTTMVFFNFCDLFRKEK